LVAHTTRAGERVLLVAADRSDRPLLQHPQQLDLHLQRHLPDLVEEDGAAGGLGEQAGAVAAGVGERALDVAEQLALEQVGRHRAAVDGHERLVLARAQVVDGAGDQLLAGAALAGDEHGRVAVGDPVDQLADPADGRALADDAGDRPGRGQGLAQPADLAAGPAVLDRAGHRQLDVAGVERLDHEVPGAGPQRRDRGVDVGLAGDDDHRDVRVGDPDLLAQLDARQAGHADVGDDDVVLALAQRGQGGLAAVDERRLVAAADEEVLEERAFVAIVVDDEHP
jgi:hypothetical protein